MFNCRLPYAIIFLIMIPPSFLYQFALALRRGLLEGIQEVRMNLSGFRKSYLPFKLKMLKNKNNVTGLHYPGPLLPFVHPLSLPSYYHKYDWSIH